MLVQVATLFFAGLALNPCSINGLPIPEYDVVIIGGGISGLTTAYELKKNKPDTRLIVLEAGNRVGGRTFSVDMRAANQTTDRFDLGGQWLHSLQTPIVGLLAELGVQTFPQYITGSRLYQTPPNNNITRDYSAPGVFSQVELDGILRVEALLDNVDFEGPLTGDPRYEYWNQTTVSDAMNSMNLPPQTVGAIDGLIGAHFDTSPKQMSMLFFLMAVKSTGTRLSVMLSIVPTGRRIAGGSQTLSERLAKGIDVRRGQEAVRVSVQANIVTVTTRQGATFTSNYVVMAIPPVMAGEIAYSPPLSQQKMTLLSNLRPMGDDTKFVATYQSAFWRQANLTGNTQFRASEAADAAMSLINDVVTFDTTTAFGTPALVGYYVLSREDESDMTRQQAMLNIVATLFGNDAARHPIAYKEQRWNSDVPFSKGGAGTLGVGQVPINYATLLRSPSNGRIYWAGTETATQWTSYMNGAVQAGQQAASDILQQVRKLNAIPQKVL